MQPMAFAWLAPRTLIAKAQPPLAIRRPISASAASAAATARDPARDARAASAQRSRARMIPGSALAHATPRARARPRRVRRASPLPGAVSAVRVVPLMASAATRPARDPARRATCRPRSEPARLSRPTSPRTQVTRPARGRGPVQASATARVRLAPIRPRLAAPRLVPAAPTKPLAFAAPAFATFPTRSLANVAARPQPGVARVHLDLPGQTAISSASS